MLIGYAGLSGRGSNARNVPYLAVEIVCLKERGEENGREDALSREREKERSAAREEKGNAEKWRAAIIRPTSVRTRIFAPLLCSRGTRSAVRSTVHAAADRRRGETITPVFETFV